MRKVLAVLFSALLIAAFVFLFCTKESPTQSQEKDYTGTISGFVYSHLTGKPQPGVLVTINADSAQASVSDATGRFYIGAVKAGSHALHFTSGDYEDTAGIVVTVAKGEDVKIRDTIRLNYRYYILSGQILYGSSPIPGAGVAVGNTPISSLVGTDGKFTLDKVPKTQDIELICAKSKVGFAIQKVTAPLANDTTKVGQISLNEDGATISGTVYDTAGNPLGNVIVAAVGGGLVDTTNYIGYYSLGNVPSNIDVRIFVPGQSGLSGAVTGLFVQNGATLSGIDILLRPQADISAGNGMALTVNDFLVIDTARSARLTVYPTTNDTTVIKSFIWTFAGKSTMTVTTTVASLTMMIDSLKRIAQPGAQGMAIKATVVAVNSHGGESKPQSFEIKISSAKPTVTALGSDSLTGARKDTVIIEAGSWAWLFGSAYAPFGGIDTLQWNFGDGTAAWKRTDSLQSINHKYSKEGTFFAVFSVLDAAGELVSDTVVIKAIASSIPKPTLVAPADNDTNKSAIDSVTLVWNKVPGSPITYTVFCDTGNKPPVTVIAQGLIDTTLRVRIDSGRTVWWAVEAMKSGKSGPATGLKKGLVAYYPFNGNAKDESGNGNNGTVSGATLTSDRFGNASRAYQFNGTSNYIDCGSSTILNVNQHSVVCWVNIPATVTDVPFVSKVNPNQYETISLGTVSSRLATGFATGTEVNHTLIGKQIPQGNWHFVGMAYDGTFVNLFIDGAKDTTFPRTGVVRTTTSPLQIGLHGGDNTFLKGSIDDIRIYNHALSPAEIDSLYHEGGWIGNPNNNPPVFSTKPTDMLATATVGNLYKDTINATDTDGDTVKYAFKDSVAGMTLTSGVISWTPVKADIDSHTVSVLAKDGKGGLDTLTWTIIVSDTSTALMGPSITTQPKSQTVTAGQNDTFSVTAMGTAPLSYQWYQNGTVISGATSSSYILLNVQAANSGTYTVTISNGTLPNATSTGAMLAVNPAQVTAPGITFQPQSDTVTVGQSDTFSVTATGTAPLSYQWYQDGTAISGATSSSYVITSVVPANAGTYTVKVFNGTLPNATSAGALFTVNAITGGTAADIDGHVYRTVKIGTQIWMMENLKTARYNDGSAIPLVSDVSAWNSLGSSATPGYCWYNNDSATYKDAYGALYNWYAVNSGKLAPKGWHVPSDSEWTMLINYLGGANVAASALKEAGTMHWTSNSGATDSTDFLALPGGYRYSNTGAFGSIGSWGNWWTSTAQSAVSSYCWGISLDLTHSQLSKGYGCSVRCIQDP
jgi:uncharacterized protein (TIGR02145 family)